jgi:hypothetical protein
VNSLSNAAVVVEPQSQNVTVPVVAQPTNLSANAEPLEAGTLVAAVKDLAAVSVPARREDQKVDETATGKTNLPSGKSRESSSTLDATLSLLDDLFSDLSLLP